MELLIKNGFVYDPLNDVNGEKMDARQKTEFEKHLTKAELWR